MTDQRTMILAALSALLFCVITAQAQAPQKPSSAPESRSAAPAKRLFHSGEGTLRLPAAAEAEDVLVALELERGKSQFIRPDYAVKRVAVGDPAIADVVIANSRSIQVVAKQVGDTNILLWDSAGQLQAAIDVHVGVFRAQVVREFRRVLGNEDIEVDMAGDAIILKGTAHSLEARERAEQVALAFFAGEGSRVINLIDVGGNQQVMIEVTLAEVSRSFRRQFGTNFRALVATGDSTFEIFRLSSLDSDGSILVSEGVNLVGKFSRGDFSLDLFIDALQDRGVATILAEPTLVARSGEHASFLAGGEVPIPIAQEFGSISITYKKFGVGVEFVPTVLAPDRIHLQVTPEVSAVDVSLGTVISGVSVPAFRTRRVSTAVELADGQSFAIAGLLRDDIAAVANRIPGLGDIPVLGALFRSQQFQKSQTELVIIVTPHIVKPLGPGPHPLPTDHYIEPTDREFYLEGRIEGSAAGPGPTSGALPTGGFIGDLGHRVSVPRERSEER